MVSIGISGDRLYPGLLDDADNQGDAIEDSILYIESRDTEVYVHLADGTAYRNKTPISRWESILGSGFLRVHRAWLVNASRISQTTPEAILIGGTHIPVSRKYRDNIK